MRKSLYVLSLIVLIGTVWVMQLKAQERSGWITGSVADSGGGILPGARVELQPQGSSTVTNHVQPTPAERSSKDSAQCFAR
jgi:hypothetical protein